MKSIDILRLVATAYGFRFLGDDEHVYNTVHNYLNSSDAPKPESPRGDACNALRRAMEHAEDIVGEDLPEPDESEWAMDITSVDRKPTLEEVKRVLNYYRL